MDREVDRARDEARADAGQRELELHALGRRDAPPVLVLHGGGATGLVALILLPAMDADRFTQERQAGWAELATLVRRRAKPQRLGPDALLRLGAPLPRRGRRPRARPAALPGRPGRRAGSSGSSLAARQAVYADEPRRRSLRSVLHHAATGGACASGPSLLGSRSRCCSCPMRARRGLGARRPGRGARPRARAIPGRHRAGRRHGPISARRGGGVLERGLHQQHPGHVPGRSPAASRSGSGPRLVLIYNGVLLGAVFGLTIENGATAPLLALVAPHGCSSCPASPSARRPGCGSAGRSSTPGRARAARRCGAEARARRSRSCSAPRRGSCSPGCRGLRDPARRSAAVAAAVGVGARRRLLGARVVAGRAPRLTSRARAFALQVGAHARAPPARRRAPRPPARPRAAACARAARARRARRARRPRAVARRALVAAARGEQRRGRGRATLATITAWRRASTGTASTSGRAAASSSRSREDEHERALGALDDAERELVVGLLGASARGRSSARTTAAPPAAPRRELAPDLPRRTRARRSGRRARRPRARPRRRRRPRRRAACGRRAAPPSAARSRPAASPRGPARRGTGCSSAAASARSRAS